MPVSSVRARCWLQCGDNAGLIARCAGPGGGTLAAPHTPWSLDNLGHSHKNGVYTHAVGIFQALVNHNPCSNELHGIVYTVYRFIGDLEKIETFIIYIACCKKNPGYHECCLGVSPARCW